MDSEVRRPGHPRCAPHCPPVHLPTDLIPLVGVPEEESQEVEPGALPDEDEVQAPVSQVGGWGQAFGAPGTSTGHVRDVDGQELPTDDMPLLHLL